MNVSDKLKSSIVLLSGGIDSTVAAVMKANEPTTLVHLLTVLYDQGAMDSERIYAYKVADWLLSNFRNVVEHFEITMSGSVRTHKPGIEIGGMRRKMPRAEPTGFVGWRRPGTSSAKAGYPSTRDEAFVLLAAAGAEARLRDLEFVGEAEIVLATNRDDLVNYDDIFFENYATHLTAILDRKHMTLSGRPVKIDLPLIDFSKAEVVKRGLELGAPLEITWSCYFGIDETPCGSCDQCRWRAEAFRSLGLEEPFLGKV
jgi:7-cyano-7-deazaguanine synthase